VYTLLKSEVGPWPEPSFPQGIDLEAEDRKARRRLYPVTVIYTLGFLLLMTMAYRSSHLARSLWFVALGVASWTLAEYLVHRYILHGAFPKGPGLVRRGLHILFDASHADHHARPWDGMYINGHVDTLFAAAVMLPLSLLAPPYTASVWVATLLLCYAAEEWVHHAMHFWTFRWSYYEYIRRRHLYHHSRHGVGVAYGITSGIWDGVLRTRIPARERELLLPRLPSRQGPAVGA
jgi:sterol desaturase/sphingolipid hydroxylase (fatty acid hydroxylase superfamily)